MVQSTSTIRWICKKSARKSLTFASRASGLLDDEEKTPPYVRVITYHRFGSEVRNPFCIAAEEFDQQMAFLAANDLAISLHDFQSFIIGEYEIIGTRILVTIDDGFKSTNSVALPILEQYGIPSVAFISPALIDDQQHNNLAAEPYMTWSEVSATSTSLMKIGSHSLSHTSYGALSEADVADDANKSREMLEAHLPYRVRSFAYPFGTQADFSEVTGRVISDCGFTTAFTSQHGPVRPQMNAFTLPRIKVESGDTLQSFRLLTRGAMDPWRYIDRFLWLLQANK